MLPAALCAYALTGCSLAPRHTTPQLPVAPSYPADAPVPADGARAEASWRDYFADARLRELIEVALEHNRDLRIAALRVEEARAAYGIQRAELYPNLSVTAGGSRTRTPGYVTLIGRPLVVNLNDVQVNLATWEIDFWETAQPQGGGAAGLFRQRRRSASRRRQFDRPGRQQLSHLA
jgi:multidrug efflux system outer membrane protein